MKAQGIPELTGLTVEEFLAKHMGHLSEIVCPKCGELLYMNDEGYEWCSNCHYGEVYEALFKS